MRGLKQTKFNVGEKVSTVAPYMGAWIETDIDVELIQQLTVAHYMGAWIETQVSHQPAQGFALSHPIWVRGLKL